MTTPLLLTLLLAQSTPAMPAIAAGRLEGRPRPAAASSLQARVDAAPPGATIDVEPGTYSGDLYLDRPLRLVGHGRPRLVGSGSGSVVLIRADDVSIEGFDIDGQLGGSLADDASGIHIAARRATVRDVRITRAYFGIYLRQADGTIVADAVVRGVPGVDPGDQGSGIHVYDTHQFRLIGNLIEHVRDGIYIQSSNGGTVTGNTARWLRYGLHYMFSDDNTFEDNRFEDGAAGAALMNSRRLRFSRNRFLHNRGFASVGLLLKDCEDVVALDNLVADNARGIFLEGGRRNEFRRNLVAESDVGVVLYDSTQQSVFEGNAFVANLSPLSLVGRRTDTRFDGNYWSDAVEPDLDGDGVRDGPHRLSSVFDHFRGNLLAADLFAAGPAAQALAVAERAFPVLVPVRAVDLHPLARPPALPGVPVTLATERGPSGVGLLASAATFASGLGVVRWGRRRQSGAAR